MDNNHTETVKLDINGNEARKQLKLLKEDADRLRHAMAKAAAEKGIDSRAFKKAQIEFKKTENEILKLQKQMVSVEHVMKNLDKATPKELNRAMSELNRQLNSGYIARGSQQWQQYQNMLKQVKGELAKVKNESKETSSWIDRFNDGMNRWQTTIATAVAALMGLYSQLIQMRNYNFEKTDAKSKLQAITGLDVNAISWLTDQARTMATNIDNTGMRVRQSVAEIVDAFRLVGSNKPELLQNKEGLSDVTKEVIRLAQAANMDLEPAVLSVTTALNQYKQGAQSASKFVNALAAGSKYGAADVNAISKVILRAGTAANLAKVPFEQLVGAAETLAETGLKNERAGTALKTFLLRLETGAEETRPSVVGLVTALERLKEHSDDTEFLKKNFGMVSVNAAKALIDMTDRLEYYTKAVTGTRVANEQAAIMGNNAVAVHAQLINKLKEVSDELYDTIGPAILGIITRMTKWTTTIKEIVKWLVDHRNTVLTTAAAIVYFTIVLKAGSVAMALWAAKQAIIDLWNTKLLTSFKKLWTAIAANPYMAIAAVIGIVVAAVTDLIRKNKELSASAKIMADAHKEIKDRLVDETNQISILRNQLNSSVTSYKKKKEIIEQLKKLIPGYTAELDGMGNVINENKKAVDDYIKSLEKQIELEIYSEKLKEMKMALMDARAEQESKRAHRQRLDEQGIDAVVDRWWYDLYDSDFNKRERNIKQLEKDYEDLLNKIANVNNSIDRPMNVVEQTEDDNTLEELAKEEVRRRVQALETAFAERKLELARLYQEEGMAEDQYREEIFNEEQKLFDDKMKLYKKDSQEYLKLQEDKMNNEIRFRESLRKDDEKQVKKAEDLQKEQVDLLKKEEKEKLTIAKQSSLELQKATGNKGLADLAYLNESYKIEQEFYDKKMLLYNKDSQDYRLLLVEKEEKTIEYQNKIQSMAASLMSENVKFENKVFQDSIDLAEKLLLQGALTQEQFNQVLEDINKKRSADWIKAYKSDLLNHNKSLKQKKDDLKKAYEDGLIDFKSYTERMKELNNDAMKDIIKKTEEMLSRISDVIGGIGDLMEANANLEIALIEKNYDRQIEMKERQNKDTSRLEKEKADKIRAINIDQAEKQKNVDIAQALLNTALSVSKTFAEFGFTPWGIAAAALASAQGAIQVATISKQADAKIAGFATGGFTGNGFYGDVAGVVHKNEFVANHDAVNNRELSPLFSLLDYAQKNNTVGSLTTSDIMNAVSARNGYMQGGFTPASTTNTTNYNYYTSNEMKETLDKLMERLDAPFRSYVLTNGDYGVRKAIKKAETLDMNKSRR